MPVDVYGWGLSCASCEKLKARVAELEKQVRSEAEELVTLRKLKTEVWDDADRWMRWCDLRALERIEALEKELAERQVKA